MSTLLRIDTLIEVLRAQLEHGGMTYEEAVVTEDFLSMLEQTRANFKIPEVVSPWRTTKPASMRSNSSDRSTTKSPKSH